MRGLLLKDWYNIKSYCRSFLWIVTIFIVAACFTDGKSFFVYYPCILPGLIATTLISCEEKEKWNVYAATLPFDKTQIVSSKYIVSLLSGLFTISAMSLAQTGMMLYKREFDGLGIINLATSLAPMTLLPTAILLPFIYKWGAEKGRMMYYIVICGFCGSFVFLGNMESFETGLVKIQYGNLMFCFLAALMFGASWRLSVRFYQKREL